MKDVHVFESLAIPVDSSGNIVICVSEVAEGGGEVAKRRGEE